MSLPAAAGYVQLKPTSIPKVYSRVVNVKYYQETYLPKITNSKYVGEIKDVGDEVEIWNRPDIPDQPYTKGMTLVPTSVEPTSITLKVQRGRYFAVPLDVADEEMSHIVLGDEYLADGTKRMAIGIERDFFKEIYTDAHAKNKGSAAGAESSGYNLGVAGTPVLVDTTNAVQNLTLVHTVLGEQNADMGGKFWMCIPWWYRYLLVNSDLKNASLMGDSRSVQRTSMLGEIDGVMLLVSNLLDKDNADGATNIVFGNSDAVCFAGRITKTEVVTRELGFGKLFKSLRIYDWKTIKPEGLGNLYAKLKV